MKNEDSAKLRKRAEFALKGRLPPALKQSVLAELPRLFHHPLEGTPPEVNYACLEVRDSGCGIAKKYLDQLFDPFYSTKFVGRGLGLPVVLGILRTHGGFITVKSKPNHGSTFRIFLPIPTQG